MHGMEHQNGHCLRTPHPLRVYIGKSSTSLIWEDALQGIKWPTPQGALHQELPHLPS